jgi:hypothetical protein
MTLVNQKEFRCLLLNKGILGAYHVQKFLRVVNIGIGRKTGLHAEYFIVAGAVIELGEAEVGEYRVLV